MSGALCCTMGKNRLPLLDSLPEVFYRPEDLYVSRQWGIRTEEWMGYRRTVSEAVVLAELGEENGKAGRRGTGGRKQKAGGRRQRKRKEQGRKQKAEGRTQNSYPSHLPPLTSHLTQNVPTPHTPHLTPSPWSMALSSTGFLDSLPGGARDRILPPILDAWSKLRELGIPLVGYISASRSGEALNFLRLQACPYDTPDCPTHCNGLGDREGFPLAHAPCQVLEPLKDAALWAIELQPGQRSPLWKSSARILDLYGDHHIYFCYVHVGTENCPRRISCLGRGRCQLARYRAQSNVGAGAKRLRLSSGAGRGAQSSRSTGGAIVPAFSPFWNNK